MALQSVFRDDFVGAYPYYRTGVGYVGPTSAVDTDEDHPTALRMAPTTEGDQCKILWSSADDPDAGHGSLRLRDSVEGGRDCLVQLWVKPLALNDGSDDFVFTFNMVHEPSPALETFGFTIHANLWEAQVASTPVVTNVDALVAWTFLEMKYLAASREVEFYIDNALVHVGDVSGFDEGEGFSWYAQQYKTLGSSVERAMLVDKFDVLADVTR